jgi:alpha-beta hydrolase superfamily lysophospholipase
MLGFGANLARLVSIAVLLLSHFFVINQSVAEEFRYTVVSDDWQLIGDLRLPESGEPVPVVAMFNKAAGDRHAYVRLAEELEARGIASLRLDLRGHGESTNLGRFVPGEVPQSPLIWDAESDVIATHKALRNDPRFDADRIAMVGASYSGEEMAEAGRKNRYASAYVVLSPGSFSEESIAAIDTSTVPWLFVTSRDDRFLQGITAAVRERSESVELIVLPGDRHATDILQDRPDIAERIAAWLGRNLY